jgi:hypothetical protein
MADLANKEYSDWQTNIWPTLKAQSEHQQAMADQVQQADMATQAKNQQLADDYQARMKNTFYPVQDSLVKDATDYNTQGNVERQSALAMGDVRSAFDQARNTQATQMKSYGVDPTSGQFQGMWNANQVQGAEAEAAAGTRARDAAVQLGWAKKMDAAGLGAGLPGNQATSTSLALNAGSTGINAGQVPVQNTLAQGGAMGAAAAIPVGAYGNIGQLGAQNYQTQVNAWAAQQQANAQASAGWGKALGTIVGTAAGAYFGGPAGAAAGAKLGGSV